MINGGREQTSTENLLKDLNGTFETIKAKYQLSKKLSSKVSHN
jgi:hypothetical protein